MKKIISAAIALTIGMIAFAQQPEGTPLSNVTVTNPDGSETTTTVYQTDKIQLNKGRDNWFIGLGLGGQIFCGENDRRMKFGDRIAPALDFSVGKWVTPSVAVDVTFSPAVFKGLYYMHSDKSGVYEYVGNNHFGTTTEYTDPVNPLEGGYKYYEQKGSYFNLYTRVIFDAASIICGYDPTRRFTVMPFVGAGWIQGISSKEEARNDASKAKYASSPSFNAGFILDLKLSEAWSLNLTGRGALVGDHFDGEATYNNPNEGYAGVTVGATYRISKKRNWDRSTNTYVNKNNDALLSAAQKKIRDTEANMERLLAERDAKIRDLEKSADLHSTRDAISPYYVSFTLDKYDVIDREKINLAVVAKIMKANPEVHYTISGYADVQTGTAKHNQELSENRADSVYKVLVEEFGVNSDQLTTKSCGGVDVMYYNDNVLTRCAVITADEN